MRYFIMTISAVAVLLGLLSANDSFAAQHSPSESGGSQSGSSGSECH